MPYVENHSPITGIEGSAFVRNISVKKIVDAYKRININVANYFKENTEIEIRTCSQTGYAYYYPSDIFGDGAFYEDIHSLNKNYYPEQKEEYQLAINYINAGDSVLEVGCATGCFMHLVKNKGANCTGIELNNDAVALAKQKGFNVSNELLREHSFKNTGKYDVVCSFQVLEHIADVKDYFESAKRCLKPGGKIIIGVPNSNPFIYRHDIYHTLNLPPHHAGLWNKSSMEKTGLHFNLQKITIKVEKLKDYKEWYLAQARHYKEQKNIIGALMFLVPRPVYKFLVRCFSPWIEGRNMLAVFKMG
ncbi:class I SAM-dependent methyltransferase [Ferruginibacter albus]|uniref:class I SAM-dependent methyltransferase n=1 Tax=Ferruginibacter albus TaxID=2875540 RepID=UPI001CC5E30C|nr:class I SAM-dependent methyltransferase [Ferruginibacter albus]UAY53259.1 class I SAM-dependent methyltransferase [Ferruginibacter albus]